MKKQDSENLLSCAVTSRELYLDPKIALEVTGLNDANLKLIAERTNTCIKRNGEKLFVEGLDTDVQLVERCINSLARIAQKGIPLLTEDIPMVVSFLSESLSGDLLEIFGERIDLQGQKKYVFPRTPNQSRFVRAMKSHRVVFGVGPAGTGKSYLSVAVGVSGLLKKQVKKLILCRPAIEAGEKLGFLPGTIEEKIDPYMRPLFDALIDLLDLDKLQEFIQRGVIEVAPLAFMRGRTLAHSFVVLDEAQNTTVAQMKMFLTRLGFGSTFVINGDLTQIDLPKSEYPGLLDAVNRLQGIEQVSIIHFCEKDVVRDPLVKQILKAYEE
ncbi:MAG: PhoH family protein [Deltaproteobacteria bacterium]|nr:PhoH family protein [Deltaproteobacteria bacterium]